MGAGIYSNVVRILVPLVVTDADLEAGLDILDGALRRGVRRAACAAALLAALAAACNDGDPGTTTRDTTATQTPHPEGRLVVHAPAGTFPSDLLARFAEETGCTVRLRPPLQPRSGAAGGDLAAVDSLAAAPILAAGLAQPLDLDEIEGARELRPQLRDQEATRQDGEDYGVPYLWFVEMLIMRRQAFEQQPDPISWRPYYAPDYAPRIVVPDEPLQIAVAANYLGVANPFALDRPQLTAATELLRVQAELGVRYAAGDEETIVALAEGWIVGCGPALGRARAGRRLRGLDPVPGRRRVDGVAAAAARRAASRLREPVPLVRARALGAGGAG